MYILCLCVYIVFVCIYCVCVYILCLCAFACVCEWNTYCAFIWKKLFKSFQLLKRNAFSVTLYYKSYHFFITSTKLFEENIDIQASLTVQQTDLHITIK